MSSKLSAPRWTHIALPVGDLEASLAFYDAFTPLSVLERFTDANGQSAWLIDASSPAPFVLVLVAFNGAVVSPTLSPFAHLGIEVGSRREVEEIALRARIAGCLSWEPIEVPPPVGYICALRDPDGNVIEISFGQQIFERLAARAGETPSPA